MTPPQAGWADHPAALALAGRHRVRVWEPIPWVLAMAFYFAFPKHLGFGTELLVTILFAISLDLVLGYAGIVTLGHAAFFGAGAYTVGMLAKHGIWNEPITGLILAALVAAAVGLGSGLVLLRTHGLTLLMLTLCTMALLEEAANLAHNYTGGFDGLNRCNERVRRHDYLVAHANSKPGQGQLDGGGTIAKTDTMPGAAVCGPFSLKSVHQLTADETGSRDGACPRLIEIRHEF